MDIVANVIGILVAFPVLVGAAYAVRMILVWDRADRDRRAREIAASPEAPSDVRTSRPRLLILLSPLLIVLGIWPFALIGLALAGWYGVAGTAALAVVILLILHSDMKDLKRRVNRIRSQRGHEPQS